MNENPRGFDHWFHPKGDWILPLVGLWADGFSLGRGAKLPRGSVLGWVMYSNAMIKPRIQDHDGTPYSRYESLGLRFLIQFGMEKESERDNIAGDGSITNVRRVYVSNMTVGIAKTTKGPGQLKNQQIKDIDHVVQRPRAILSSPDNDYWIGEMNKKASKRDFIPKTRVERLNVVPADAKDAQIRTRGTRP
ncbi:hypothetical protein QVD17_03131 [Tagetes erecta]|uniref:Uncharacterized protein n=1 Tax=Tagetes erecta TaxID=13708 RepID=A0AAD8P333_TARER|nr:hypothetical protein QVD17_03131 [Tagetes erecta]